ncbi:hypothetical protein CKW46_07260 [Mycobacterium liflandii]|nr:hypothetical protein CKW46_07260 [Mycobacterium liflandii]
MLGLDPYATMTAGYRRLAQHVYDHLAPVLWFVVSLRQPITIKTGIDLLGPASKAYDGPLPTPAAEGRQDQSRLLVA